MAEIVEVQALSAHRIRLSVQPLEGALPMFLPGQSVPQTTILKSSFPASEALAVRCRAYLCQPPLLATRAELGGLRARTSMSPTPQCFEMCTQDLDDMSC
jgi:hypothetical protein